MDGAAPTSSRDVLEGNSLPELAEALRSRLGTIMTRWEASVRQLVPTADALSFAQLRNDSMIVLRKLADALGSADPAVVVSLLEHSRQHATARFDQKYNLRGVLVEYRLLRRTMMEELEFALHRSLTLESQVALHLAIDAMLEGGVVAFVEYQQGRLQALTEKAMQTASLSAEQARTAAWAKSEHAKAAVALATEQARAAVAVATEQAKVAAHADSEQAKEAAWAIAEQATAAAWDASEQAKLAVALATEESKAAVAVATEQARVAAATTSEQAKTAAEADSEEATAVALATSEQARDVALADKVVVERARDAAEAATQSKNEFLAVLSHELRNPLNPVVAIATLLRDDPRFDADTREQLEVICRNAELAVLLIDDLLDVTRIGHGKIELNKQPIALGTILHHAAEVCQADIKARKLHFAIDLSAVPNVVEADPVRLQQVFWNLIRNAIKFTPAGGCVGIRCRREGDGHVMVDVHDSGEGISADVLPGIFKAFEQGGRQTTRKFGGLGLGLTIAKAMIELHGGSIEAHSEGKGKGATFTIRLPLMPDGSAKLAALTESASPSAAAGLAPGRRPLRILLVEDQGDTAQIMRRVLSAKGYEVQIAADMATALQLAAQHPFDVLLSDLGLPDGSGLDLMRALRQRGLTMPGIALSGYGQDEDIQRSREAGFAEHLVKPVNLSRLEEAITRVVGHGTAVAGGIG